MKRIALIICTCICTLAAGLASADGVPLPVRISHEQVQGRIFTDGATVTKEEESELGTFTTHDVEAFLSSDRKFDAGMCRAGPNVIYSPDEPVN